MQINPGIRQGLSDFLQAISGIRECDPQFRLVSQLFNEYWNQLLVDAWNWQAENPCLRPDRRIIDVINDSLCGPNDSGIVSFKLKLSQGESQALFRQMLDDMHEMHDQTFKKWIRYRRSVEHYSKIIVSRYEALADSPFINGHRKKQLFDSAPTKTTKSSTARPIFDENWSCEELLIPSQFLFVLEIYSESEEIEIKRTLDLTGFLEEKDAFQKIKAAVYKCSQSFELYLEAITDFAGTPISHGWTQSWELSEACRALRRLELEWKTASDIIGTIGRSKNRAGGRPKRSSKPADSIEKQRVDKARAAISGGRRTVPEVAEFLKGCDELIFGSIGTARKWVEGHPEIKNQLGPAKKGRPAGSKNRSPGKSSNQYRDLNRPLNLGSAKK